MLFTHVVLPLLAFASQAARAQELSTRDTSTSLVSPIWGLPADILDAQESLVDEDVSLVERSFRPTRQCVASQCLNPIPPNAYRACTKKAKCSFLCSQGFRWNGEACNPGKSFCRASECTNEIPPNARRICKHGFCDFGCIAGYHREYNECKKDRTTCSRSSECTRHRPPHSHVACIKGTCAIVCNDGFRKSNGICISNDTRCSADSCAPIKNGSVYCGSNGKCVYECNTERGYRLIGSGSDVRCVNRAKDPNACGKKQVVCPPDYAGIGKRACTQGKCTLICPPPTRLHTDPGMPMYCA